MAKVALCLHGVSGSAPSPALNLGLSLFSAPREGAPPGHRTDPVTGSLVAKPGFPPDLPPLRLLLEAQVQDLSKNKHGL